jgi:transglutaminase-like putative cysteine protease
MSASNITRATIDAREFLLDSPMVERSEALADYARPSFHPDNSLRSCVNDLTTRIFTDFSYDPGFSTIATPLHDVLAHRRGVCQDFAHLQVGCLRSMGIPAKYVSGYIETLPKPGQAKLVGADATHAWVAYLCPEEGWVEFDPTNNTLARSQHIVTAFGRDYLDVTPVKGVIFGGGETPILQVSVDVARVQET